MKGLLGSGIVLLIVGLLMLAAPMISYTDRHKAVDIGPLEVETETEKHVSIPQSLGVVAAAAGVVLIVTSQLRSTSRV
jgi:uncharacterized membrane protein HdeD (DUF308 family)